MPAARTRRQERVWAQFSRGNRTMLWASRFCPLWLFQGHLCLRGLAPLRAASRPGRRAVAFRAFLLAKFLRFTDEHLINAAFAQPRSITMRPWSTRRHVCARAVQTQMGVNDNPKQISRATIFVTRTHGSRTSHSCVVPCPRVERSIFRRGGPPFTF